MTGWWTARRTAVWIDRDRIASALGVAAVHLALGYALIAGLGIKFEPDMTNTLQVIDLPRQTPPPALPEEPDPVQAPAPEASGASAPPDLTARPTPVVAPLMRLPAPPLLVAAPVPRMGADTSAGAAAIAGPGTGAGGEGEGTGIGASGIGPGGGGQIALRARHIAGRIRDADYPRQAGDDGAQGTVIVHFAVGVDGRVSGCKVVDTSGNDELDAATCRIVERRFRYEPARDASGLAVPDVTGWKEVWWIGARRPRMVGEVDSAPTD